MSMYWFLLNTKPRQEKFALENLQRQSYHCYLPTIPTEKLRRGILTVTEEPLFPRYLFIRLGLGNLAKSWAPIRSTRGVSRLVSFGVKPARVDDDLIELLRINETSLKTKPKQFFQSNERVYLTEGPFAGIEGIYQLSDGERRVAVLIEILNKPVVVHIAPSSLRKAS